MQDDRGCHARCCVVIAYVVICFEVFLACNNQSRTFHFKRRVLRTPLPWIDQGCDTSTLTHARRVSLAVTWLTVYRQLKMWKGGGFSNFCLLFIRSILMILVFSLNLFMFYQPVIVVCPPMRCRWGKERWIGHVKGRFFEHVHRYMKIIISTVIRSSVEWFVEYHTCMLDRVIRGQGGASFRRQLDGQMTRRAPYLYAR